MIKQININFKSSEFEQLCELFNKYKVGYVRMIETNPKLKHIKQYVLNHKKNIVEPFLDESIKIKIINIVQEKCNIVPAMRQKMQGLILWHTIKNMSIDNQILYLYKHFKGTYIKMLKQNKKLKSLYQNIINDPRNNTRVFKYANIKYKVLNLIKNNITINSRRDYVNYILSTVMPKLRPSRQILFLRRMCSSPVKTINDQYPKLKKYILENTKQLGSNYSFATRCFWIMYNIKSIDDPRFKCKNPNCSNSVLSIWQANGLNTPPYKYCCAKCRANDEKYKEALRQSVFNKYGVTNPMQSEIIKNKTKNTMHQRYGVDYAAQNSDIYKKVQASKRKKYGNPTGSIEKLKAHFTNELRSQIQKTCLKKFGVCYPFQCRKIYEATIFNKPKTSGKPFGATSSKEEHKLYELLINKFGYNNVITHYKSNIYPFYCDFYIKSLNLYIEYNGYWMHGGHPFNCDNQDDIIKLNLWNSKINSTSYKKAINIWTQRDILKRSIAKQNNLNYIELWNLNDVYKWIEQYGKTYDND